MNAFESDQLKRGGESWATVHPSDGRGSIRLRLNYISSLLVSVPSEIRDPVLVWRDVESGETNWKKLNPTVTRIGRNGTSDIVINSASVSRRHAEFHCDLGLWMIVDVGSSNGTIIDGERITRKVLGSSRLIQLGSVDVLFFVPDELENSFR